MKMILLKKVTLALAIFFTTFTLKAQTSEITNFGTNPGNLKMFLFEPSTTQSNPGVVLVMHGCGQNATDFANETGWNVLAEQYGFYVIYAEQKLINNPTKCFNWFKSSDNIRNSGESLSLLEMINHVQTNFSTDSSKTFVCGLSAGGSMTPVMMACYPDVFNGGGIWAGVPYLYQAGEANEDTPLQWGNKVRNAFPEYSGKYPRLYVCQGTKDAVVDSINRTKLVAQWTNVHGINQTPDIINLDFNDISNVDQHLYLNNSTNDTIVNTYTIHGMGHGIAVDPGTGAEQGGITNTGSYDVDFYSTYWMARFFNLIQNQTTSIDEEFKSTTAIKCHRLKNGSIKLIAEHTNKNRLLTIFDLAGRSIYKTDFFNEIILQPEIFPNSQFLITIENENGIREWTKILLK